ESKNAYALAAVTPAKEQLCRILTDCRSPQGVSMRETDRWLSDYGDSHRNISSPAIYWPAVLALVPGITGMLWSLPTPAAFSEISPLLNWGSAFLMASLVYYFIISLPLAIGMLPFI